MRMRMRMSPEAAGAEPMLRARKLCKRFGEVVAVDGIDLDVEAGETVVLCGPDGAGKTTTLRLLAGLVPPSAGELAIDGFSVTERPIEARVRLCFVPEDVQLHPYLSGPLNLAYFYSLGAVRVPPTGTLERALVDVGLPEEALQRPASTFSMGMRQQVMLALAWLRNSAALLLDEPTTELDEAATARLEATLGRLRSRGVAVLVASRDPDFARSCADRVVRLRDGRQVQGD